MLLLVMSLLGVFVLVTRSEGATEAGTITLDPSTTYQTISGWQTVAEIGLIFPNYELWRDTVADMAANDLGINRIMFLVRSDYESPNDNDDPFEIDPSGFDFSRMELQLNGVVIPLKQSLASRGENLHINLKFFNGDTPTIHSADPEEYAELIEAVFLHTQSNYGWVPDSVDVVNEPKPSEGWTGTEIGNAILAAAARLEAHGFTPFFIAPSGVTVHRTMSIFDDMVANVPSSLQYLGEISYHCYRGCEGDVNLLGVGERALQHGINSSMTEKIRHTYEDLHRDLKLARVSAWEQFALAFPLDQDNGAQYYVIDNSDPSNPVVNIGERTKFLRQYFKFIRSGALRIEATSTDGNFDPVAFINTGGDYVVVVKADNKGEINIQGLPAGNYGIKYTTSKEYDFDLPDVVLASGQVLTANIPDKGVITIYGLDTFNTPTPRPQPDASTSTPLKAASSPTAPASSTQTISTTTPTNTDAPASTSTPTGILVSTSTISPTGSSSSSCIFLPAIIIFLPLAIKINRKR